MSEKEFSILMSVEYELDKDAYKDDDDDDTIKPKHIRDLIDKKRKDDKDITSPLPLSLIKTSYTTPSSATRTSNDNFKTLLEEHHRIKRSQSLSPQILQRMDDQQKKKINKREEEEEKEKDSKIIVKSLDCDKTADRFGFFFKFFFLFIIFISFY